MLTAGVIKPIHEATPWINSFILVESQDKNTGKPKLCICLDLTNLNKAIIHEPYCFHTPEDIAHKLSSATVKTVLNCSKGYWHRPLDDESSFLTTFNTKISQFRFTVMPFRTTVTGDVFQRKLDSIFLILDVMIIADHIMVIVYQEDEQDHDIAFMNLLETTKKRNIKLNLTKFNTNKKKWNFLAKYTQHRDVNPATQKSKP